MKHSKKIFIALLFIMVFAMVSSFVIYSNAALAGSLLENINAGLRATGGAAGFNTTEAAGGGQSQLMTTVGTVIKAFLTLLGIVFLVIIIWAGFNYMLSRGDTKKAESARGMILTATIGLIIILAAYAITTFVITTIGSAT